MGTGLQEKKDRFICNLDSLICDFERKSLEYHKKYIIMSWCTAATNACITFFLGLSFLDTLDTVLKIVSLLFSSVLIVINKATDFLNYKNRYERRTYTLMLMKSLKREFSMKRDSADDSEMNNFSDRLEILMRLDLERWSDTLPNGAVNAETNTADD